MSLQNACARPAHGGFSPIWSYVAQCGTERIPDTGMGTPIAKRGMRLVRLLRAMKGAEKSMTPGELALLHDHAMGDSIVLADDGHAANIEQPKAFNEALLGFLRAG